MKLEVVPVVDPKSSQNMVDLVHGLMDMVVNNEIDFLKIQYRLDGEIYSYSLGKK